MNEQRPGDNSPLAPRRPLTPPPASEPGGVGTAQSAASASSGYAGARHAAPEDNPMAAFDTATTTGPARSYRPIIPPMAETKQKPTKPAKAPKPVRTPKAPRTTRRARLRLIRLDPWSVMKTSFLLSIAFGIMCVVAVFVLMSILTAAGLWDNVNATVQGLINAAPGGEFDIQDYLSMSKVMGITLLVASVDVVFITALATLGAFIYNLSASLLGGVEVTLAEDQH